MLNFLTNEALSKSIASLDCRQRGRQALAMLIALTLLNLLAMVGYGTPTSAPDSIIGTITTLGVVRIGGAPVTSRQTLFSGSGIVTSAESESTLDLTNLTRLKLGQETSLKLKSTKFSFSASLDKGVMRALTPSAVVGEVKTSDAVIATDPGHEAAFTVIVEACSTTLFVQTGKIKIRARDYVRTVSSGERFSTDAGPAVPPLPPPHLSNGKKIGLLAGIGGAIAILLIALKGKDKAVVTDTPGGGCVIILSPTTGGGGCS